MKRHSVLLLLISFMHTTLAAQSEIRHSLILMGDTGWDEAALIQTLSTAQASITTPPNRTTFLFLGDLAGSRGLAPGNDTASHLLSQQAERALQAADRVIFVPGEHDWANGRPEGWEAVQRQERYLDTLLRTQTALLPETGCPGPYSVFVRPTWLCPGGCARQR